MKEGDKVSITKDIVLPILMGIISGLILIPVQEAMFDNDADSPEPNTPPIGWEGSKKRSTPETSRNRELLGRQHPDLPLGQNLGQIDFDFGTGIIANSTMDNVTSVLQPRRLSSVKFQSPSVTPLKSSETDHQFSAVSASSTGYAEAFDENFMEIIQAAVNIAKEPVPEPVPGLMPETSPESVPGFVLEPNPRYAPKSVPDTEPVPEPLTVVGSFTALGVGIAMKKRASKKGKK